MSNGCLFFCHPPDFWSFTCPARRSHLFVLKKSKCSSRINEIDIFDREILEAARAASCIVEQETDEGFAVVNLVSSDKGERFGEGKAKDFDVLVSLRGSDTFADVAGEVDLHPFCEEAGAGEVLCQQRPAFGAVARLFDQLAFGGCEGRFVGFNAACRQFDEHAAGRMAVLTLKDDVGVIGISGLVDGEDHDGAIVADDVADIDTSTRFFHFVGDDREDFAFVCKFRGN
jgi:hypothetical protein